MKKIKEIWLLIVVILGLSFLSVYTTYGLYTSSNGGLSTIGSDTKLIYEFNINSNQVFTLDEGKSMAFTMIINNTSGTNIYYEIYKSNLPSGVTVSEIVENAEVTTVAPNTSGNLANMERKEISLIVKNDSYSQTTITIGVAGGYIEPIIYGTGVYPTGVSKITTTFTKSNIPIEHCTVNPVNLDTCVIREYVEDGEVYIEYTCPNS